MYLQVRKKCEIKYMGLKLFLTRYIAPERIDFFLLFHVIIAMSRNLSMKKLKDWGNPKTSTKVYFKKHKYCRTICIHLAMNTIFEKSELPNYSKKNFDKSGQCQNTLSWRSFHGLVYYYYYYFYTLVDDWLWSLTSTMGKEIP